MLRPSSEGRHYLPHTALTTHTHMLGSRGPGKPTSSSDCTDAQYLYHLSPVSRLPAALLSAVLAMGLCTDRSARDLPSEPLLSGIFTLPSRPPSPLYTHHTTSTELPISTDVPFVADMADEGEGSKAWGSRMGIGQFWSKVTHREATPAYKASPEATGRLVTHLTWDILLSRSLILSFTSFISEVIL